MRVPKALRAAGGRGSVDLQRETNPPEPALKARASQCHGEPSFWDLHAFASEGIKVIRTPVRAPNANAHMERWVGSVRRECLDRLLIFSRRQLEQVLRVYARHYGWKSSWWTGGRLLMRECCWARVTAS